MNDTPTPSPSPSDAHDSSGGNAAPGATDLNASEPDHEAEPHHDAEPEHVSYAGETPPTPPAGPPPGQGPPHQRARRLTRSVDNRLVGGVAAGLARHVGIDVSLVRVALVLAALTGVGVVVYLVAWVVIPEASPAEDRAPYVSRFANPDVRTLAFVFVGVILVLLLVDSLEAEPWHLAAVTLIAAGLFALHQNAEPDRPHAVTDDPGAGGLNGPAAPPNATTPNAAPPNAAPPNAAPPNAWATSVTADPAPTVDDRPTPRHREPQPVTKIVLSVLALLAAVTIAASTGGWWDVSAVRVLGVAIVIVGIGIVVGAVRGGSRWLIPLGILATLLLAPVAVAADAIGDGVGARSYSPRNAADLQPSYSLGAGSLELDLRQLDLDGATERVDVEVGIGELIVRLPDDVGGVINARADIGEIAIQLPDTTLSDFARDPGRFGGGDVAFWTGPGRSETLEVDGLTIYARSLELSGDNGELILDLDVGVGVVEVSSWDR